MTKPTEGAKAPDFVLPRDGGKTLSLDGLKGKHLVLYFYPKDMTPGCTSEAIAFSELRSKFNKLGAVVVGVSRDRPARHDKFIEKHGLKVILASDEDGEMLGRYGVWVEKKLYGRTYMGIERATFLIDSGGVIRKIWHKVKVKGHAEDVLAALAAM